MNPKSNNKHIDSSPRCPLCRIEVYVGPRPLLGDAVICLECGAALEVVRTRPVAVDLTIGDGNEDTYFYSSKMYPKRHKNY